MPVQNHLNIMAGIPKKTGGSRTVATATTIYRLLMALDNARLENIEKDEAYGNDSARAGASASTAAEDRALEAELMSLEGRALFTILWDFKKFFDMIDIEVLIQEAAAVNFPMEELVMSLTVHQAPRRLKVGKAIGDVIDALGRAILAGCKRSTQMARAYTLRMVRRLSLHHPHTELYQHVDDMSNLVKPTQDHLMTEEAVRYVRDFADETKRLKMEISDKSIIIPETEETRRVVRIVNREGIQLSTATRGVDIGVDTAAASTRTTAQQKERIKKGEQRSKRAMVISKANKRAAKLAITNIAPCEEYGMTSIGVAPTSSRTAREIVHGQRGLLAEEPATPPCWHGPSEKAVSKSAVQLTQRSACQ